MKLTEKKQNIIKLIDNHVIELLLLKILLGHVACTPS